MSGSYRYLPDDFRDMLGMTDDLTLFYELYEEYSNNKSQVNLFALEKQGRDLFFTIKHRVLAGQISANTAYEMKQYIEEFLND